MFSEENPAEEDDYSSNSPDSLYKATFFNLITPLISSEYFNYLFKILIILIETFQLLSFAFHNSLLIFWKSPSIIITISSFFDFFMIMPYLVSFTIFIFIFYIICAFSFLITCFLLYITVKNPHENPQIHLIFRIAKLVCEIFPQILFMPMLEVLLMVFNCNYQENTGKWVHRLYSSTICYENTYILHVFASGITIVFITIFGLFISFFYYECRLKTSNFLAKSDGKHDIWLFLYKTLLVFLFTIFDDYSELILMGFLTIPSFLMFSRFIENFPYYNLLALKCHLTQQTIITWTGFMVIFGKITFEIAFDANLFLYFFGIFLLILIIFIRKEYHFELLLININKIDDIAIFLQHVQYLIFLTDNYRFEHGISVLLDGYVQYHRTICNLSDCQCKKDFTGSKKHQKFLENGEDEQILRVNCMINGFFVNIIQKKPYNAILRIKFSIFLLDRLDQKQLALHEISTAFGLKPSLSEEFLIFRFKRIIEFELLEKKKSDNLLGISLDSINELALNSLVKNIKASIEKSTSDHLEFWSQLSEDIPNLGKLFQIGKRIIVTDDSLDENWLRLKRMNIELPSLLRLFAGYLFTIIGDKSASSKLFAKLNGKKGEKSNKNSLVAEFVNNSQPVVFISGEEANLAVILNLNQSAAGIFGYNKGEIINKKINVIMPESIAEFHDIFIENYLMKLESKMMNKEVFLPVLHRNGYLIPMYLTIRNEPFALKGRQFFAVFRKEKTFKYYLYLFCEKEGNIEVFSSSCVNLLDITKKKLMKKPVSITEIIPGFYDNLSVLKEKNGGFADVNIISKSNKNLSHLTSTMPNSIINLQSSGEFMLNSNEIANNENIDEKEEFVKKTHKKKEIFLPQKLPIQVFSYENAAFGLHNYLIRIEYIEKKEKFPLKSEGISINRENWLKPRNTAFKEKNSKIFSINYDISSNSYKGGLLQGEESDIDSYINQLKSSFSNRENSDIFEPNPMKTSLIYQKLEENLLIKKKSEMKNVVEEAIDLAKGIRAFRLMRDRILDLEDLNRDNDNEENSEEINENIEDSVKKADISKESSGISLKNSRNIFKNRDNFLFFLKKLKFEKNDFVRNLHGIAMFLLIIMAIIFSINHFLFAKELENSQISYNLIDWSNQRIAQTQLILYKITEISFIYQGISTSNSSEILIKQLKTSVLSLESLQNSLVLNSFGMNSQHKSLFSENSIPIAYLASNGNIENQRFDINQITSQIISKANFLSSKPLSFFNAKDPNFFFLSVNLISDFYNAMRKENQYFIDELSLRIEEKSSLNLSILLISVVFLMFFSVILSGIYAFVLTIHQRILLIFMDISLISVKKIFGKCEGFLNHLQVGEEEEVETNKSGENSEENENNDEELEENASFSKKRKKRKKYTLDNSRKLVFFVKLLIISMIIEVFFIVNYSITSSFSEKMTILIEEFNVTSIFESYYSFSHNILRRNISNSFTGNSGEIAINSTGNSGEIALNFTDLLISLVTNIEKTHSKAQSFQNTEYKALYDKMFNMNLCEIFSTNELNTTNCDKFADGTLTQGLFLAIYRFIDNYRRIEEFVKKNTEENLKENLLNYSEIQENNEFQNVYFKFFFRFLMKNQLLTIEADYSATMKSRLILYVCFIILLIFIYIGFWIPVINSLNTNLFKIKRMLAIIPLENIENSSVIRENIQAFLNIHD